MLQFMLYNVKQYAVFYSLAPSSRSGRKLGFLPDDLSQKVNPYLWLLYDTLFEMLDFEKVKKLIERAM
ncbi:MAG: PhoH family protein [Arsenophonus sp. NC-CH8-MAG3]